MKKFFDTQKFEKLELGEEYNISVFLGKIHKVKLIKVTKCGYNFLDQNTNKCIFPKHLYLSKWDKHEGENWFRMHKLIIINKI